MLESASRLERKAEQTFKRAFKVKLSSAGLNQAGPHPRRPAGP
jgi:hypothetical protein